MFNSTHIGRQVSAPSFGVGRITKAKEHESKSPSLTIITVNFDMADVKSAHGYDTCLGCNDTSAIEFWATGHAILGGGAFPLLSFYNRSYTAITEDSIAPGTIGLINYDGGFVLAIYVSQEFDNKTQSIRHRVILSNECEPCTIYAYDFHSMSNQEMFAKELKAQVNIARGIASGEIDTDDLPF